MLGTTLLHRYRLDAVLGQGGMGTVYRAQDLLLDRAVAVKVLQEARLGTQGRNRLMREARAAAQLNHPNIVGIYDAGEIDDVSFIVMELVAGRSLYEAWPLPLAEVLAVARQVCAALEAAHARGIIHRDLKLENILLTDDGQVKLTDFGLARSLASRLSEAGSITGTVFYLAPELALGQPFDGRADLYALGVVLYELTTGKLPFTGDDPLAVISQHLYAPVVPARAHQPDLPPALDALISRLLAKRPEDRPAAAAEVRAELEAIEQGRAAAPAEAGSPLEQLARGRLIGRAGELAQLLGAWRLAAAGDAGSERVLLVSGEPGVGKTRLVRELITQVEVSGARALTGECYAEAGTPYAPMGQLIEAGLARAAWPDSLPGFVLADLVTLCPALQTRYPEVRPNPPLDPQAEQQRLFESVAALCAAQAADRPLLLVVDDVHWADAGSLAGLRYLARRARASRWRLLIVLTYREVELDQAHPLQKVLADLHRERLAVRLKLGRLNQAATLELLRVLFGGEIAAEVAEELYRETEGNPFFVEEVCKALVEEGQLQRREGRWQRADAGVWHIPQSVRLVIQARAAKLSEPAQAALRVAAVIGREFDFELLRQAGELNEEALVEALEAAEQAQLIQALRGRPEREAFAFVHALIPAALLEGVSSLRRHRLHRRVAAGLEQLRPNDFEKLAYHYSQAGDEARTLHYLRQAGERARAVYANDDARRCYTEALALTPEAGPERFDLLAARAAVLELVADRAAQRADVEALQALAAQLGDPYRSFEALLAKTDLALATDVAQAAAPAGQAAELARQLADPLREGLALRRLGWVARLRGEPAQAREKLQTAAERFLAAGRLSDAAACQHMLSLAYSDLGREADAQQAAEHAVQLSRQAGDRRQEATSLRRLAILPITARRFAEGRPLVEAALALHRQLGDRAEECHALNVLGLAHAGLLEWEAAERLICASAELASAIGFTLALQNALINRISLRNRQRDYQAALELADELQRSEAGGLPEVRVLVDWGRAQTLANLGQYAAALAIIGGLPERVKEVLGEPARAEVLALTGLCLTELGRFAEAQAAVDAALAQSRQVSAPGVEATALFAVSGLDLAMGRGAPPDPERLRQGRKHIERALAVLREQANEYGLIYSLQRAAELDLAMGEPAPALAAAAEAVRLAEGRPDEGHFIERALFSQAQALRALGQGPAAETALRRARAAVMEVAGRLADSGLRQSWLEGVALHRALLAAAAALPE